MEMTKIPVSQRKLLNPNPAKKPKPQSRSPKERTLYQTTRLKRLKATLKTGGFFITVIFFWRDKFLSEF